MLFLVELMNRGEGKAQNPAGVHDLSPENVSRFGAAMRGRAEL